MSKIEDAKRETLWALKRYARHMEPDALCRMIYDGPALSDALSTTARLSDQDAPMGGDDGDMTRAEETLAWLLIEKFGQLDDIPHTPRQAGEIIAAKADTLRELDDQNADLLSAFRKLSAKFPAENPLHTVRLVLNHISALEAKVAAFETGSKT